MLTEAGSTYESDIKYLCKSLPELQSRKAKAEKETQQIRTEITSLIAEKERLLSDIAAMDARMEIEPEDSELDSELDSLRRAIYDQAIQVFGKPLGGDDDKAHDFGWKPDEEEQRLLRDHGLKGFDTPNGWTADTIGAFAIKMVLKLAVAAGETRQLATETRQLATNLDRTQHELDWEKRKRSTQMDRHEIEMIEVRERYSTMVDEAVEEQKKLMDDMLGDVNAENAALSEQLEAAKRQIVELNRTVQSDNAAAVLQAELNDERERADGLQKLADSLRLGSTNSTTMENLEAELSAANKTLGAEQELRFHLEQQVLAQSVSVASPQDRELFSTFLGFCAGFKSELPMQSIEKAIQNYGSRANPHKQTMLPVANCSSDPIESFARQPELENLLQGAMFDPTRHPLLGAMFVSFDNGFSIPSTDVKWKEFFLWIDMRVLQPMANDISALTLTTVSLIILPLSSTLMLDVPYDTFAYGLSILTDIFARVKVPMEIMLQALQEILDMHADWLLNLMSATAVLRCVTVMKARLRDIAAAQDQLVDHHHAQLFQFCDDLLTAARSSKAFKPSALEDDKLLSLASSNFPDFMYQIAEENTNDDAEYWFFRTSIGEKNLIVYKTIATECVFIQKTGDKLWSLYISPPGVNTMMVAERDGDSAIISFREHFRVPVEGDDLLLLYALKWNMKAMNQILLDCFDAVFSEDAM